MTAMTKDGQETLDAMKGKLRELVTQATAEVDAAHPALLESAPAKFRTAVLLRVARLAEELVKEG